MTLETTTELPDKDGHDLRPVPGTADLIFSTDNHVYLFDREKAVIREHPELKDRAHVKCIDIHPKTGSIFLNQADGKNWWSDTFELLNPAAKVKMEGEKLYKGRWVVEG